MATSSTQSGFVDSWQRGKSVTECNIHMLETEDFTDVTFLVGSEKHVVRAQRYVLASRSCVFHAMFCGRLAEQGEILIPDIEVNDFRDFLRFLYTDTCTINSKNIAGLLYTSRKYDVETLFTQSSSFLEKSLSEESLCEILEKSHGYRGTDLEQNALRMLSQAGPKVIKSAGFLELCSGCFGTFLKSEKLNLTEEEIFEAALSWTKAECEKKGLSPSHENMRKILGEMVFEIRFASLSLDFIANVVGPSGILTDSERLTIMDRILKPSRNHPFMSNKSHTTRNKIHASQVYQVNRFRYILEPHLRGSHHSIRFCVDKNITLLGCQQYGSDPEVTKLDIHLYDEQDSRSYYREVNMTLSDIVNDVMFPDPVSIQAWRVYRITIYLPAQFKYYGGSNGESNVRSGDVEFTFFKYTCAMFSSVENGQIPGLIWRY